ncbi:MAG: hypothetical protein RIF41_39675 [Polyangiaceae bacterium]
MTPSQPAVPRPILCAVIIWVLAIATGLVVLNVYSATPGADATEPASRPADPALAGPSRRGAHATLIMAIHPRCACSRASLAELARLMTRLRGRVDAYALFVHPPADDDWASSDLVAAARRIDGVVVMADPGGRKSRRLGATTSGTVALFDASSRLRFTGGLTPRRGHQGDSVGRQQILAIVEEGRSPASRSAVYGCALAAHAPWESL